MLSASVHTHLPLHHASQQPAGGRGEEKWEAQSGGGRGGGEGGGGAHKATQTEGREVK